MAKHRLSNPPSWWRRLFTRPASHRVVMWDGYYEHCACGATSRPDVHLTKHLLEHAAR